MKLIKITLKVNGNKINFKNEYLKSVFVGKGLLSRKNKYGVRIASNLHPQIDVAYSGKDGVETDLYLQGSNGNTDFVWGDYEIRKDKVEHVVGTILMSLANFDIRNSTNEDGEDKISEIVLNGIKYDMDISKQLEIARFLLGDKL
jgi:hypothetical protein